MKKMNRLDAIQQAMDALKKQELADNKKLQEIKGGGSEPWPPITWGLVVPEEEDIRALDNP